MIFKRVTSYVRDRGETVRRGMVVKRKNQALANSKLVKVRRKICKIYKDMQDIKYFK